MDITPYVERLRHEMAQAVAATDEQTRAVADRIGVALDSAVRLTLMEALSEATAEITSEMRAGSVEVRLNGRDLDFVVADPAPASTAAHPNAPTAAPAGEDEDDSATARITLRLPESLKAKAEEFAANSGHSLNTWIVNVLRAATRENAVSVDIDLSSIPFLDDLPGFARGRNRHGSRRMTGWI
jgi:antitoxin component of RelBE/YafQ-DinJ toxin-antitoxin module